MTWKEQLEQFDKSKDWSSAVALMRKTIDADPEDIEAYISFIYFLHNILLEEDYSKQEEIEFPTLLKKYYDDSSFKFSENAEYLFFVAQVLYIGEWFFGVNDDSKPIENTQAFQMQKKASQIAPGNALYEWAWRFSLGDHLAAYLAKQILNYDADKINWLKKKGQPGKDILNKLQRSANRWPKDE